MQVNAPEREDVGQGEQPGPDSRDALVGEQVVLSLGRPPRLQRIQARRLWGDYYRVNVFVGESLADAKVTDSFFVLTDARGGVLTADPVIAKLY